MSDYDLEWLREVLTHVCGISFLIVATYIMVATFSAYLISSVMDTIAAAFLVSGVIAGWMLVIIDCVSMHRGNEDD